MLLESLRPKDAVQPPAPDSAQRAPEVAGDGSGEAARRRRPPLRHGSCSRLRVHKVYRDLLVRSRNSIVYDFRAWARLAFENGNMGQEQMHGWGWGVSHQEYTAKA